MGHCFNLQRLPLRSPAETRGSREATAPLRTPCGAIQSGAQRSRPAKGPAWLWGAFSFFFQKESVRTWISFPRPAAQPATVTTYKPFFHPSTQRAFRCMPLFFPTSKTRITPIFPQQETGHRGSHTDATVPLFEAERDTRPVVPRGPTPVSLSCGVLPTPASPSPIRPALMRVTDLAGSTFGSRPSGHRTEGTQWHTRRHGTSSTSCRPGPTPASAGSGDRSGDCAAPAPSGLGTAAPGAAG